MLDYQTWTMKRLRLCRNTVCGGWLAADPAPPGRIISNKLGLFRLENLVRFVLTVTTLPSVIFRKRARNQANN